MILGLDMSTTVAGYAFCDATGSIHEAGFLDISKHETNKAKSFAVIQLLDQSPHIKSLEAINLEASLSGFGGGGGSSQVVILLARFNAVAEYIISEYYHMPVNLVNVLTARKKVFGKARVQGIKPKEYVKMMIPQVVPNLAQFEVLNKRKRPDKKNGDTYDAMVMALYSVPSKPCKL
jgi:hypothetical protein